MYMKLMLHDFWPAPSAGHADWILHFETTAYVARVTGSETGIQNCISAIPLETYVPRPLLNRPDLVDTLVAMYKNKWHIRHL